MMASIVEKAEGSTFDDVLAQTDPTDTTIAVFSHTLKELAKAGEINAVVSSMETGPWAETLLRTHPEMPLFLAAPDATAARQCMIRWGVQPFVMALGKQDPFAERAIRHLRKRRLMKKGTKVAVVLANDKGAYDLMVA